MYRWGHVGASLLTYAPIGGVLLARGHDRLAFAGGALAAALSTLPDCDNALPGLDHRGPTHTLWFALGVGGVLGAVTAAIGTVRRAPETFTRAALAAVVGALTTATHVAVDSLTPMGVWPFAPVSERYYCFDVVASRNRRGNAVALALGLVASVLAAVAGTVLASGRDRTVERRESFRPVRAE